MELRFDGKRALVTGAGKGIGRGIAIRLAELGADVIAVSRTKEDLDSLKIEVPSIDVYTIDLRDWEATRLLVQGLGPVDLLVNNAGNNIMRSFLDVSKEDIDSQMNVNFMAPFNISQIAAKGMVERNSGGAIVMISSIAGMKALEKRSVYCSTKGALDQLTRCLALELGPHKIRVNSVNPTVVLTTLARRSGWGNPEIASKMLNRIPLGHFAGRRHWVLTEESPRLTTMDDNNTLTVFAGYYTRSFFPLPAFLNDVAGNKDMHESLDEFKFRPDTDTNTSYLPLRV